jgi:prepilin-type N-terminal cleavage/methylation domain-containing protein
MNTDRMNMQGFTLVEVVATLVLVGILASVAGLFIVSGLQGYQLSADASDGALKAQIALNRIHMELRGIDPDATVTLITDTSISYDKHVELDPNRSISYDGTNKEIRIGVGGTNYRLIDGVTDFALSRTAVDLDGDTNDDFGYIDVGFTLEATGSRFELRVYPRNLYPAT